jgi:hypothetical protein
VIVLVLGILALGVMLLLVVRPLLRCDEIPGGKPVPPVEVREPRLTDLYAARLALSSTSWVSRRVERFEFLDATTVRRHMSIDFVLPFIISPEEDDWDGEPVVVVPLMLPKRGILRGLDVTDAEGRSLNVLESAEGNAVTLAGIRAFISEIAEVDLNEVPPLDLNRILTFEPDRAVNAATMTLNPRRGAIGTVLQRIPVPDNAGKAEEEEFRGEIIDTLGALITELASGFLLLVAVPYRPNVPSLVKVSYDTRIGSSVFQLWRNKKKRAAARLWANRLFSSLALVGRVEYFTGLEVRRSKSYHAEVVPATGTYCEEANLCLRPAEKEGSDAPRSTRGVYRDFHHSHPHLWVGDGGDKTNRGEDGVLEISLFAAREGLILPLFFSAALIAGVLSLVLAQHPDVDGITLGAVLLAPVALAAYYARSDENGYLTMAMRGARYVATFSIVSAITAIAVIALGYVEVPDGNGRTRTLGTPAALCVMEVAAWVALACAVLLAMALCAPILNERFRRFWFKPGSGPLPRGGKMGQPDLRMTVFPALLLFAAGALATIILAKTLHM